MSDSNLAPCGHHLGKAFNGGYRCSSKSCGKVRGEQVRERPPRPEQMQAEEIEVQQRFLLAQLHPTGIVPSPTHWAEEKLKAMLPEAVAQLQWDLRKGSAAVRSVAAEKVLRANGLDKREAAQGSDKPTIVLNLSMGDTKAPWLERLKK